MITARAPMHSVDPQTVPVRVRYREEYRAHPGQIRNLAAPNCLPESCLSHGI